MKNVAILAVILGVLGNPAIAESAINQGPNLALAYTGTLAERWLEPAKAENNIVIDVQISEEVMTNTLEQVSDKLNEQLEDKIAKEFDYAMQ